MKKLSVLVFVGALMAGASANANNEAKQNYYYYIAQPGTPCAVPCPPPCAPEPVCPPPPCERPCCPPIRGIFG